MAAANVAGKAVRDGAILIDLGRMQAVSVDPGRRTGLAQGGARWAAFDAATTAHGLVTTGGTIATTGVAGLTVGGGATPASSGSSSCKANSQ